VYGRVRVVVGKGSEGVRKGGKGRKKEKDRRKEGKSHTELPKAK